MSDGDDRGGIDPARERVDAYERSVPVEVRRAAGVHYTPAVIAEDLCGISFGALGRIPRSVVDPSCGGGAFLLAVADRLAAEGVPPDEVVTERVSGVDTDQAAVGVARRALSDWAGGRGARVGVDQVRIHQGDGLLLGSEAWPGRPPGGHDLVIGNPPFLGQLDRRTTRSSSRRSVLAQRFPAMGPYTDESALFLAAGLELVAPGGVVALVQPQSVLSTRDTSDLRDSLCRTGDLVALWVHEGMPFADADVYVCAPVLRRGGSPMAAPRTARTEVVWRTGSGEQRWQAELGVAGRWGELLAPIHGVPVVGALAGAPLGSVATATAGFRDEFYALCEAATESEAATDIGDRAGRAQRRLVTVGMIDPFRLGWGAGSYRLGGRRVSSPVLDDGVLVECSPRVAGWVERRSRPKVLVATQTKVLEAVVDPLGDLVPVTPTISVEPLDRNPDVWHLGAALVAPPVAAHAALAHLGSGRSPGSLRWSARALLEVPLPLDREAWASGADLARRVQQAEPGDRSVDSLLDDFAVTMTMAHGLSARHPVVDWWSTRRPRR